MMLKASAAPNSVREGVPVTTQSDAVADDDDSLSTCYFTLVKYMCATGAQVILTTEQRLKLVDGLINAEREGVDRRQEERTKRSASAENKRLQETIGLIIELLNCQKTSSDENDRPSKGAVSTASSPSLFHECQRGNGPPIDFAQWLKPADHPQTKRFTASWVSTLNKSSPIARGQDDGKHSTENGQEDRQEKSADADKALVSLTVLDEGRSGDFGKGEELLEGGKPSSVTGDASCCTEPSTVGTSDSCSTDRTEHSGSNQSVLTLWQFLLEMLHFSEYSHIIRWRDKENGIFKIYDSQLLADLWGLYKRGQHGMSFDKMSRAMRFYYGKEILSKDGCEARLDYRFGPRGQWRSYKMPPDAVPGRLFKPPPVRISRRQRRKAAKRMRMLAEMGSPCSPEETADMEVDIEAMKE